MKYRVAYQFPDTDDVGYASKSDALIVNSAGYEETDDPGGTLLRKKGRTDYYLAYNHAGKMKVKINGAIREAEAGSVFLYLPYEEQYYGQVDKATRMANYWVHFTGYGVSDLLLKAGMPNSGLFATGVMEELPPLFEAMIAELAERRPHFSDISSALLQQIVFRVSQRLATNERQGKLKGKELLVSETMGFIRRRYMKDVTVSELAHRSGLSASRFSAVFKEQTGQSPQRYLIGFRLQKAKEYLTSTTLNIRQISALSGFDDQLYFSKLFRKYEGMTPSQFREAARKKQAMREFF